MSNRRSNNSQQYRQTLETIAELQVPAVELNTKSQPDRYKRPCVRLEWERGSPICSIEEPRGSALSVQRTFAPRPRWIVLPLRFAFLGLSATTLYFDITQYPTENLWIYCGFFHMWVFIMHVIYQICSFLCCTWDGFTEQPISQNGKQLLYSPGFFVHLTWLFFSVSVNLGLLNVILYWVFLFEGGVGFDIASFTSIAMNAGVLLVVLTDGFVIGKIPIRIKHVIVVWFVACLYLVWMGIQELLGLGNGNWAWEDPEDDINDDVLYENIQWKNDPYKSYFYTTLIMFVVVPVLFLLTWFMSFAAAGFKFNGTGYRLYDQNREDMEKKRKKGRDDERSVVSTGSHSYITGSSTEGGSRESVTGSRSAYSYNTGSSSGGNSTRESRTNYVECP